MPCRAATARTVPACGGPPCFSAPRLPGPTRLDWPILPDSAPPPPVEATLTPSGRLHLWAPSRPAADVARWVRSRTRGRWPGGRPEASAAEAAVNGSVVPGLALAPLEAAVALGAAPAAGRAGPDSCAPSLRFWTLANGFLLDMLKRGRFRPTLSRNGARTGTRWQVDFRAAPAELDALRLSVPPRALERLDPEPAIRDFLTAVGDSVIRDAGRRLGWPTTPPPPDIPGMELVERVLDDLFAGGSDGFPSPAPAARRRIEAAISPKSRPPAARPFGSAQVALTLEPPADGVDPEGPEAWSVRFGLVEAPDAAGGTSGAPSPTLSEIWDARDPAENLRRFGVADPAVPVLACLGRAARLAPELERGLCGPTPEVAGISAAEAFRFLHDGRETLRRAGFAVRVPSTLARGTLRRPALQLTVRPVASSRDRRKAAPAPARTPVADGLGLDALVDYDWRVVIGDESWSIDEFRRLTRGRRLVQATEGWVEVDSDAVNRLFNEAARRRARAGRTPVLRDALRERLRGETTAGDLFDSDEAAVLARIEGEEWIGALFQALEAGAERLGPLDPPRGLRTELRPYQRVGYSWLRLLADHGLGGCLADDMGLGKTCQALSFLLGEQEAGRLARPWLLVCPNSIISNWRKEAERFAPSLRLHVRHGPGRTRAAGFEAAVRSSDLVICSFGIVHRDLDDLQVVDWGGLIVDEAQNLKNPGAKQTRAVRRLAAPVRFALTGTPIENRLTDLWSIMEVLNPGLLGPQRTFRRAFSVAVEGAGDPEATAQLRRLIRPFMLRRLKTDPRVLRDLPEKHQTRVYCNLTPEQASLYRAAVDSCLDRIGQRAGFARRGEILRTLTRLKQICNHPENFLGSGGAVRGRSGKLTRLEEILSEVRQQGERALVFTQFAEMARLLGPHLSHAFRAEVPVLHGGVPTAERDRIVTRFQTAEDAPPFLVLSLKTGGYGLNLTRASHVVHYDRWWNPAVENQATDRAFRIGQQRRVLVHKFLCAGTLEERIENLLERKSALAESVIGSGEAWLTSLSGEALRDVLSLGADAVAPSR